jgi:hypothetical protein
MTQTRMLISEGVNDLHRQLRMRARPKILLARNYEEGISFFNIYEKNLLGVISDIKFPRYGELDDRAGFQFAEITKERVPDLPFLLQSSNIENRKIAHGRGLDFLHKNSENLLHDLQQFILRNFGFGDFVFRDPTGRELGRARNLHEFENMLEMVSDESLEYHATRNHISLWLRARTEFETAERLRPKKVSDFENLADLRSHIRGEIQKLILKNQSGVISDFDKSQFEYQRSFIRLGGGSLGGKARGIAFINALLAQSKLGDKYENVSIQIPQTFVISSGVFEEFMQDNNLQEFAISENTNEKVARRFLRSKLPAAIVSDLKTLLENVTYPLAIRSSSILEDSQTLPFAGLYSTFMLPNNDSGIEARLAKLCQSIKLVFASVFYKSPKEYVRNTNFRIEEEKMAVIVQRAVGQNYANKFYPVVSGVAQSYNFYPVSHMEPEDGVAQLALGLGSIVVEGAQILRYSPRYPEMNPLVSSPAEWVRKSQNYFYALDLSRKKLGAASGEKYNLLRCELQEAETDGSLYFVGSTYSHEDNVIRDTLSIPGARVLTFANLLKYNLFPLSDILNEILEVGRKAFGSHIEIEFAINLYREKERANEFNWLQIRPMVAGRERLDVSLDQVKADDLLCRSRHAIGNGVFNELRDLVFVDPGSWDPSKSRIIAQEVGKINQRFQNENKNYILMGFGRWGTSDPWLGIPVEWFQISKAKLIVESNLANFKVEPSQGSHFFHNMISLKMGYFHVPGHSDEEFIQWDWLKGNKAHYASKHVKHLRFKNPLEVKINARISTGIILKPEGWAG